MREIRNVYSNVSLCSLSLFHFGLSLLEVYAINGRSHSSIALAETLLEIINEPFDLVSDCDLELEIKNTLGSTSSNHSCWHL